MHTFQPCPIDVFESNPFTMLSKDWAVLTAGDEKKTNSMTISWGGVGVLWRALQDAGKRGPVRVLPEEMSALQHAKNG